MYGLNIPITVMDTITREGKFIDKPATLISVLINVNGNRDGHTRSTASCLILIDRQNSSGKQLEIVPFKDVNLENISAGREDDE
jgi:hypothetical protein